MGNMECVLKNTMVALNLKLHVCRIARLPLLITNCPIDQSTFFGTMAFLRACIIGYIMGNLTGLSMKYIRIGICSKGCLVGCFFTGSCTGITGIRGGTGESSGRSHGAQHFGDHQLHHPGHRPSPSAPRVPAAGLAPVKHHPERPTKTLGLCGLPAKNAPANNQTW